MDSVIIPIRSLDIQSVHSLIFYSRSRAFLILRSSCRTAVDRTNISRTIIESSGFSTNVDFNHFQRSTSFEQIPSCFRIHHNSLDHGYNISRCIASTVRDHVHQTSNVDEYFRPFYRFSVSIFPPSFLYQLSYYHPPRRSGFTTSHT